MEYLDVLDTNGTPTGEKKSREEIHRDGDWHRTADVWIVNNKQELLIQQRSSVKEHDPNLWSISVGGHTLAGDDTMTTALREVEEELGLHLLRSDFEYLFTVPWQTVANNGKYINNELNDVYLVRYDISLSTLQLQKEEVADVRWIPFRELEKLINASDPQFVPHENEYKKLFAILHKRYGK